MGFLGFGHKSISKEFLTKEMDDLSSLDSYSVAFHDQLKTKIRPTVAKLHESASKGKNLSNSDIKALNGFEDAIAKALAKYSALKDVLNNDGKFDNLRKDGKFKLIKNYLDDITTGKDRISGLSTAHAGAVTETMSSLRTILRLIDSNIEMLEGISYNIKLMEASIAADLNKAA